MVEPVAAPDAAAELPVVDEPMVAPAPLDAADAVLDDAVLDDADGPAVVEPDEHAASPAARRIAVPAVSNRFIER